MNKSIRPAEFRAAQDCLSRFVPAGHTKPFLRKVDDIVSGIHEGLSFSAQEKIESANKNWHSALRELIEFKIKDMRPGSNPAKFGAALHKVEICMRDLRAAVGPSALPDDNELKAILAEMLPQMETAIRDYESVDKTRAARIEHGSRKGGKISLEDFLATLGTGSSRSDGGAAR